MLVIATPVFYFLKRGKFEVCMIFNFQRHILTDFNLADFTIFEIPIMQVFGYDEFRMLKSVLYRYLYVYERQKRTDKIKIKLYCIKALLNRIVSQFRRFCCPSFKSSQNCEFIQCHLALFIIIFQRNPDWYKIHIVT